MRPTHLLLQRLRSSFFSFQRSLSTTINSIQSKPLLAIPQFKTYSKMSNDMEIVFTKDAAFRAYYHFSHGFPERSWDLTPPQLFS